MPAPRYFMLSFISFAILSFASSGFASDEMGGMMEAKLDGKTLQFPVLKTDIQADIQGDLATIEVVQTFANPTSQPLNAIYLFPLNKDAAVYGMTMQVGNEMIEAEIKRKEKAKKTFEKAKQQGKAAALLTQHRPNMFTQNVANLMPGMPIKVTLRYTQTVPRIDGNYELVVPLIVGPRYQPEHAGKPPMIQDEEVTIGEATVRSDKPFGQWEIEKLPAYPDVSGLTIPDQIEQDRVSLSVNIKAGMDIRTVHSPTHALNISGEADHKTIRLAKGRVIDNRDFVLQYQLASATANAGMLTAKDERGGYFSLLIEPPTSTQEDQITPREMVFVLDTSGSMSGEPMAASKTFMNHALQHLRPTDAFRIIRFSNNASEFSAAPVSATPDNVVSGLEYIRSLSASGGTEIPSAITQAFRVPPVENRLRIVVFLTDGYIGNESEVLKLINKQIGDARIYAFGVGTSVNRYLLTEMGRAGRGFARFIDPTEESEEVAQRFAAKLESPVLTDISIDWGEMKVRDVVPATIPDLFTGDSIRIQGRFEGTGSKEIRVRGLVRGHQASMPLQVELPSSMTDNASKPIPLIWARTQIAEWMRMFNLPEHKDKARITNNELKEKVTELGLAYSLATRWTSFVAVSKQVLNHTPDQTGDAQVPLPKVKGVNKKAYGMSNFVTTHNQFAGHSVPEPATIGGLLVLGVAGFAVKRRRKSPIKSSL